MSVDETALLAAAGQAFAWDRPSIIGVAVSGGGDPLALLHLMQRVAPRAGWRVEAATVDHGLRPEAAAEAAQVAALCRGWGIPHEVLRWADPQGPGNQMDRARPARLALLSDWAGRRGIGHVYSSTHTTDEAAEAALRRYIVATGGREQDIESLPKIVIRPGFRRGAWHRNCVAIGLSSGFMEPLEASSLVMVELAAGMLADQMPATRAAVDIVARRYNDTFSYRWDAIVDFLRRDWRERVCSSRRAGTSSVSSSKRKRPTHVSDGSRGCRRA